MKRLPETPETAFVPSAVQSHEPFDVCSERRSSARASLEPTEHCSQCRISLSQRMMAFHIAHSHLVLRCQLCASLVQRLGISRDPAIRGQYCSLSCKEQAEERALCVACSREPDGTFKNATCLRCRRSFVSVRDQLGQVAGVLSAIDRAQVLPLAYQRLKRPRRSVDDRSQSA